MKFDFNKLVTEKKEVAAKTVKEVKASAETAAKQVRSWWSN